MESLRIATWNINGLLNNKTEVNTFLKFQHIDVLLISESHMTDNKSFNVAGYSTYSTCHPDGTAHAGTSILIRSNIKHHLLRSYQTPHIQATSIVVQDGQGPLTLTSIYCPPRYNIKREQFDHIFESLSGRVIIGGDWNAKHSQWGSRLTVTRGRELKESIDKYQLKVLTTCQPTYWPTDPKKILTC